MNLIQKTKFCVFFFIRCSRIKSYGRVDVCVCVCFRAHKKNFTVLSHVAHMFFRSILFVDAFYVAG